MSRTDILIVGAGHTGLVLANWLARLGIRRVEQQVFQVGEYVYSNLSDALASAKRRVSK